MQESDNTTESRQKSPAGRKNLPTEKKRKLIAARVSPESLQYLQKNNIQPGLFIDQSIRLRKMLNPEIEKKIFRSSNIDFDLDEFLSKEFDPVVELARGLLAMIVERGTSHISSEQVEGLEHSFLVLLNSYLATFKKEKDPNSFSI
ncbi:MAG: hypothetical protein HY819_07840 [Acidobacteria bacterium]|nr:hypothetical protein [Acidobacteriota bacterium]